MFEPEDLQAGDGRHETRRFPRHRLIVALAVALVAAGGAIAFAATSELREEPPSLVREQGVRDKHLRAGVDSTIPAGAAASAETTHGGGRDCLVCHVATHAERGKCTTCHQPGTRWVFNHTAENSTECGSCHKAPAKHYGTACGSCHKLGTPFKEATFAHDPANKDCGSCHAKPAQHYAGRCGTCHTTPGIRFTAAKVTHDPRNTACGSCHRKPANHYAGGCGTCHTKPGVRFSAARIRHTSTLRCTNCHKTSHPTRGACASCHPSVGASWAFRHPSSKTCSSCHKAPATHYGSTCASCHAPSRAWRSARVSHSASMRCTTCHKTSHPTRGTCTSCHPSLGSSWAFRHPTSTACASCHTAPAGHYGWTCASCHSPSQAFRSAKFNHPSIPGGEHSSRSFACANCHPSGYASASCTSCHRNGPPDDD